MTTIPPPTPAPTTSASVPIVTTPAPSLPPAHQVTYWATSIFTSKTFWLNLVAAVVACLSLTEVTTILPAKWLPAAGALLAVGNIILRTTSTRPVAFISPGTTMAVSVPKINPDTPPPESVVQGKPKV